MRDEPNIVRKIHDLARFYLSPFQQVKSSHPLYGPFLCIIRLPDFWFAALSHFTLFRRQNWTIL